MAYLPKGLNEEQLRGHVQASIDKIKSEDPNKYAKRGALLHGLGWGLGEGALLAGAERSFLGTRGIKGGLMGLAIGGTTGGLYGLVTGKMKDNGHDV